MATPNVTCRECEKPMVSARPQGKARHNACIVVKCGTPTGYERGCRCNECRAAKTADMRAYTDRRKAREGVDPTTAWHRKKRGVDPYAIPNCAVCGEAMGILRGSSPVTMHRDCGQTTEGRRLRYLAGAAARTTEGDSPKLNAFRRRMKRAAKGRPATGRVFNQGPCEWCEEPFCAPMGKWCSPGCRASSKRASRHPLTFNPTPRLRREVYARDGWTCGLCHLPIDPTLTWPHQWSASLDHVIPQSHMPIPDHTAQNLRAAHLMCNSMRGDGSNMSADELTSRARTALIAA